MCNLEIKCSDCEELMQNYIFDCYMTKTHTTKKTLIGHCSKCVERKEEIAAEVAIENYEPPERDEP